MDRLLLLMMTVIVPSVAGMGVVAGLVLGMDDLRGVLLWAAGGAIVGLPVAWFVTRMIRENDLDIRDDV